MLQAIGIAPLPSRKRTAPEDEEEEDDEGEALRGDGNPITIDLADDSGGSGSSWYSMASSGRYFRIVHRSLFRRLLPHLPCRQPMV